MQTPGIYTGPFFQGAYSHFMPNTGKQLHITACAATNRCPSPSKDDKGVHQTTSLFTATKALWGVGAGTEPSFLSSSPPLWAHSFSICFTSEARDCIWVTAGWTSLQYCVYVYYCRDASEDITVYNATPQENPNQNNELA